MGRDFDLFGQPLPRNLGQRGRNEHAPTAENANKIRLLLIADWTVEQIAREIGISAPTLRKHYFRGRGNPKVLAAREVKGRTLVALDEAAQAGNVGAMKELMKRADHARLSALPAPKAAEKKVPVGKKEEIRRRAHVPTGGWAGLGLGDGSDRVQ